MQTKVVGAGVTVGSRDVKRDLGKSRTPKEERRLERELKQAQIECGYAHWVILS